MIAAEEPPLERHEIKHTSCQVNLFLATHEGGLSVLCHASNFLLSINPLCDN